MGHMADTGVYVPTPQISKISSPLRSKTMKNYIDEIYTVEQFIQDNPELAEQAERAKDYLKGYCQNNDDVTYVIIEVEGYKCIAYLVDEFSPYILAEMIAPFDNDRIYPLQGLVTNYAFKRYN